MQCIVSLPVQSSPLEMSTKYPANATIFHSSLGGALNFNKSIESSVVIYFFFFFPPTAIPQWCVSARESRRTNAPFSFLRYRI